MRFLFLVAAVAVMGSCRQTSKKETAKIPAQAGLVSETQDSTKFTTIEWIEQTKDFGKMIEGQKLDVSFRFKNTGNKPLIIESVRPSCGCTAADPPKEPIAPGQEGVINGTFDSNGKNGLQHKTIYVYSNTKGTQNHELSFSVDVQKKQ